MPGADPDDDDTGGGSGGSGLYGGGGGSGFTPDGSGLSSTGYHRLP